MAASRNANGYEISSQHYFRDLSERLGESIEPARHQSISEARSKLGWEAFQFLLHEAVFVTNLLDREKYSRQEIVSLYRKCWDVETLYCRVKRLLALEKFHSRTHNGVMQEIFANLLVLSLTALAVTAVISQDRVDPDKQLQNFKNASESVRRHLFHVINQRIGKVKPKKVIRQILSEVRAGGYVSNPPRAQLSSSVHAANSILESQEK